jgi:hypothetical protein
MVLNIVGQLYAIGQKMNIWHSHIKERMRSPCVLVPDGVGCKTMREMPRAASLEIPMVDLNWVEGG